MSAKFQADNGEMISATERVKELYDTRQFLKETLRNIAEEASSVLCGSYEYDPTPTAEERLRIISGMARDALRRLVPPA